MIRISLAADRGVADPLDQARTRIKRCRQALDRMGVPAGEWSWTLEVNPAGTGYHAHALQHGPYVPQAALQEACLRAGAGLPYVNAIRARPSRTARYGMKAFGAAGYGLKTFRAESEALEALALNHGRVEHHSPGFFRIDGDQSGVRDVESAAIKEFWPGEADSYLVCDRKAAIYYTSREGSRYLPRPVRSADRTVSI
jgi:hypothetical protein